MNAPRVFECDCCGDDVVLDVTGYKVGELVLCGCCKHEGCRPLPPKARAKIVAANLREAMRN